MTNCQLALNTLSKNIQAKNSCSKKRKCSKNNILLLPFFPYFWFPTEVITFFQRSISESSKNLLSQIFF